MVNTLGCLLCSLFALSITAEEAAPKISFESQEIAKGIYMISGKGGFAGGNIAVSVGSDGVVMIDDSMPPLLPELNKTIMQLTQQPVHFLINTHVHGDHTGNNSAMAEKGTRVVAHKNLRTHMLTKGINGKPADPKMLPVITFSHNMNFHLNGLDAEIHHLPKAHTDGDAYVYFAEVNVIHAGDVFFNGMFPYIDLNSGGSVDGYIKAQQAMLKASNEKTKIIPGHGPLATKADLEQANKMLQEAVKLVQNQIDKGLSEDDVVAVNPLASFHDKWNWGFITTERMTRQLYKGLTQ